MREARIVRTIIALVSSLVLVPAFVLATVAVGPIHVGVVLDGTSSTYEHFEALIREEITILAEGEFDVRFEARHRQVGDWTAETAKRQLETALADPEVDLVIALGALTSHVSCCLGVLPKPVVAPLVFDPALQGFSVEDGGSGVDNLSFLATPTTFESDLRAFATITRLERVTVVMNRWYLDAAPMVMRNFEGLDLGGMVLDFVAAGDRVDEVLAAIPDESDGVYLAPLLHLPVDARQEFFDGLNARRLPSYSMLGTEEVSAGVLAGQRTSTFMPRLARRVALNVQRILLGEPASQVPVAFTERRGLTINLATARAVGVSPPWDVLREAELLHEEPEHERTLAFADVVDAAIDANLDLAASRRGLFAGAGEVRQVRSALLPQIDSSLSGLLVDDDRAEASFGGQAERTWTIAATLSQVLYSDPLLTRIFSAEQQQRAREDEVEQLRLDIARDAAVAYLGVLRARTLERIRKDNLRVTRSNLELAEVRRDVGDASPGEVFRWQSQVAIARRDLVDADAQRRQAEIELNRILHRPLEEGFRLIDVDLTEPTLITSRQRIYDYVDNPRNFAVFRDFFAEEGLLRSPELEQLDALIAAQNRVLRSAGRAFWAPEVAGRVSVDHRLERGGTGSDLPTLSDDTDWSVGLSATLPLFLGGRLRADRIVAQETLSRLELERAALAERIEQAIRASMHTTNARFAGIELSQEAAVAAGRNLDLVRDAYTRGTANVLDLLDAQNAALSADLGVADALYAFLIALVESERAANNLDFFLVTEEQEKWLDRLAAHFRRNGIEPEIDR